MTTTLQSAARRICEKGHWSVTNLSLQKLLYLAHMTALGRTNEPLFEGHFEAWDYGPVEPSLYRRVNMFGDQPISNVFFHSMSIDGTPEAKIIDDVCGFFIQKSPAELVSMTHWPKGAWARYYQPGVRGIVIPNTEIRQEYLDRTAK